MFIQLLLATRRDAELSVHTHNHLCAYTHIYQECVHVVAHKVHLKAAKGIVQL